MSCRSHDRLSFILVFETELHHGRLCEAESNDLGKFIVYFLRFNLYIMIIYVIFDVA